MEYYGNDYRNYLSHYGVLGMKWGIRRYQPYSVHPRKGGEGGKEVGEARTANPHANPKKLDKHYNKAAKKLAKYEKKYDKALKRANKHYSKVDRELTSVWGKTKHVLSKLTDLVDEDYVSRRMTVGLRYEAKARKYAQKGAKWYDAMSSGFKSAGHKIDSESARRGKRFAEAVLDNDMGFYGYKSRMEKKMRK